jgi:hypothetical protein
MTRRLGILLAAILGTSSRAAIELRALPDVQLKDAYGHTVSLSQFRGKPVVLLYESRESREENRALKDRLFRLGQQSQLREALHFIPIANLEPYDFFPVRHFAERYIRDLEKKLQVRVLIDWQGLLETPPWSLSSKPSAVLLFSSNGEVLFRHAGPLKNSELDAFFEQLAEATLLAPGAPTRPDAGVALPEKKGAVKGSAATRGRPRSPREERKP